MAATYYAVTGQLARAVPVDSFTVLRPRRESPTAALAGDLGEDHTGGH